MKNEHNKPTVVTKATENPGENRSIQLPSIIFGTSGLGNLFVALDDIEKLKIIGECLRLSQGKVVFDSAGKYGAGLALEVLGKCLNELRALPENVVISNKLGWLRTELTTEEPTFEPGVWKNLKHDAVQKISYDGIIECFEQGNEFLGGYHAQMVSVHDPDEYLNSAVDSRHAEKLYKDILDAYRALFDLKKTGRVQSVGVGAKDWKIIQRITNDVELDWVMIANSMTIKSHPGELLNFIKDMARKGIYVINSAVFHSGFLVGSDYFDYRRVTRDIKHDEHLFKWRDAFYETCSEFSVDPATACVQFALQVAGVKSIALNTTRADRVRSNLEMVNASVPMQFWYELKRRNLTEVDFVSSLL